MRQLAWKALITLVTGMALAELASASVLVVNASGGSQFFDIQPAVDASTDGDTILVKPGSYSSFVVYNKQLVIVGDVGGTVQIVGGVSVQSLLWSKTLVLEHLTVRGSMSNPVGLSLSSNAGRVRVEFCDFTAGSGTHDAIQVHLCNDVALTHVTSLGGNGPVATGQYGANSGAGLVADHSTFAIYGSTLRGGNGDSADPNAGLSAGANGGDGCTLTSTSVLASGSTFIGGDGGQGGYGIPLGDVFGGNGGDGMRISASTARLLEDVTMGGYGGPPGNGDGSYEGDDGVGLAGTAFVTLSGTSRRMHSQTPVRENSTFQLTFTGLPGEQVALVVAIQADYVLKLPWKGVMLLKAMHPMLSIPVGTIPAGGTLTVPWGAPDLGGLPSKVLHLQPVFVGAQGDRTLGNASCMVVLDASH